MNTIGKILVILNLIFAVLVGGFLVVDFATRTNYKAAYDSLRNEMQVADTNYRTSNKTLRDLNTQVKEAVAAREDLERKLVDQEKLAKLQLDGQKQLTDEAIERAKDSDLNSQKAIAERDRFKEENKSLTATLAIRDKAILELQESNKSYRQQAIAQKNTADAMQARNENLLQRIQELERKIINRELGTDKDKMLQDPNAPNPPSTYVKGRIDKVDPTDRSLVQISLGTDQGLKVNHTLEVYRLKPQAEYLGMIRIVDAQEHKAVGKLMRSGTSGNRGALQAGDIVASSINNQAP
jgi:hypothetical protein